MMDVRVPLTRQAVGPASSQADTYEQDDLWHLQPVVQHRVSIACISWQATCQHTPACLTHMCATPEDKENRLSHITRCVASCSLLLAAQPCTSL